MKSGSSKKERQLGKAARASARRSSAPARKSPPGTASPHAPFPRKLTVEQLEPRLLLSADGLGLAPELALPGEQPVYASVAAPSASVEPAVAAVPSSRELVFVDPRVPNASQLLAGLVGDADPSRKFEIIVLDTQRDGVVQVTAALKSRMQLDAVHFITHGSDGAVQLGGTLLDAKALAENKALVEAWGGSLKADADLLFYGCDLASTARGRALVDWIAQLTGADVAASTDATGHASRGGDWELEYRTGVVETEVAPAAAIQEKWLNVLASAVAGGEFRANITVTADVQTEAAIAVDANGDFVIVWASANADGSGYGIRAQRFDATGSPVAGEFQVNTTTIGDQRQPAVAMDNNGNFVVVWQSPDADGWGLFAQRFDAAGNAVGGEFQINTASTKDQMNAAVAMDADGDFVVAWQSMDQDGSSWGIYARRFDASGVPQDAAEFRVNEFTANEQQDPAVAMDAAGNFVVTWQSKNQDGDNWGIYARRFDASGFPFAGEFRVNSTTTKEQQRPAVGMNASGEFVIAWESIDQDGDKSGIFAQRFDAAGNAVGTEFGVNATTSEEQQYAAVGMHADGSFTIAWQSNQQDGSTWGVYKQQYTAAGALDGGEAQVNSTTLNAQEMPVIAANRLGPGHEVIAWSGNGVGDGQGIFGQRYLAPIPPADISGTIFHDVNGDALVSVAEGVFAGAAVRLYRDDGDGSINAGDTLVASALTDGFGRYLFSGQGPGAYYVVVDSISLSSTLLPGDFNAGYDASWIWAEQTFGVTGAATGGGFLLADGALYGGRRANISDSLGAITSAEHVTKVIVAGVDVAGIDSGFSFNAVTSNRDGDDVTGGSNPRTIQGSLRQFLLNANAISNAAFGIQSSDFSIGGGGPQSIGILSPGLPTIDESVILDATTQEGFAGTPLVELNGASAGNGTDGLVLTAGNSEIRGFVINRFGVGGAAGGSGVVIRGTAQAVIQGNYIGTNATGSAAAGNGEWGISVFTDGNTIGGAMPGQRNVISGNNEDGIKIDGGSGNVIQGNYIGTDRTGTVGLGNTFVGIWFNNADNNRIGGTGAGEGNVISANGVATGWHGILLNNSDANVIEGNYVGTDFTGMVGLGNGGPGVEINTGSTGNLVNGNVIADNGEDGIVLWQTSDNVIRANLIGTDKTGAPVLGNGQYGVWITEASKNTIGGTAPGDGNVIADSARAGIEIDNGAGTSFGNQILGNSIYQNAGLGIDLIGTANGAQSFPVLSAAVTSGTQVQISGTLASAANTTFRIEVFASVSVDPTGFGEGERYLGSFFVTTDGAGNITFTSPVLAAAVIAGEFVSATATNLTTGDTSEFSKSVAAAAPTRTLSGTLRHDVDGDADVIEGGTGVFAGAIVSLYRDDGDGVINAGDTFVASTVTDAAGQYTFSGLLDTTYYVVVDSKTLSPNTNVWAEQTYASAGAAQGVAGFTVASGALYGGRNASLSDDASTLGTAEHVTKVNLAGVNAIDVDFGFAFNAITTTRDGDDDAAFGRTVQGSLRQFIQNSNAIAGVQISEFEIGAVGSQQSIALADALPTITDTVVLDGWTQGAPGYTGPPLIELDGTLAGPASNGLMITAGGSTVRGLVINRFGGDGIDIVAGADGNTIVGNYIGTDATGAVALGNAGDGLYIKSANNTIGGTLAAERNVISGNADGVDLTGAAATGNLVIGNYIGTDWTGLVSIGNTDDGVDIDGGARDNTVADNVISGNLGAGVDLADAGTTGNVVRGNYIGTNRDGTLAIGNASGGVEIFAGASNNTVGGTTAAERNVIGGNIGPGVQISGVGSTGNIVRGNYIGTDAGGTAAIGNTTDGVLINSGASNNTIGGTSAADRNVISGNIDDGVSIEDAGSTGNLIAGNYIGLDFKGTTALGNGDDGVDIDSGATNNTVGGTVAGARNVVSGNAAAGVEIGGAGTSGNAVLGNYIGTNFDGTVAIGNAEEGVEIIAGASNNTVGGAALGAGNVIGGNIKRGVMIDASIDNRVLGNFIGTDAAGTLNLGNGDWGVLLRNGSTGNRIGGVNAGEGNVIAFNTADGVYVGDAGSAGNPILGNAIYSNGELGIDLEGGTEDSFGVSANDLGDADTGANNLQNFPVLTAAIVNGGQVQITGSINSAPGTDFRIEFFASGAIDTSGHGEAEKFIGFMDVTTDAAGDLSFVSPTFAVGVAAGDFVTATATNLLTGETSEFAASVAAATNTPPVANDVSANGLEDAASIPIVLAGTDLEGPIASFQLVGTLPSNGQLEYDTTGTGTWSAVSISQVISAADNAAGRLRFVPDPDWNGSTGFQFTATDVSGASAVVPAIATINIAAVNDPGSVSVSGAPTEDQTLTAGVSDIDGVTGPISYQWQRFDGAAWSDIGGATLSTYALGDLDVGQNIRVAASYTDDEGFSENLISAPVGPIANVNDPGSVSIAGTPTEDQVLTANITDPDGVTGPISYQWQRFDGSVWNDIGGATTVTYTLDDADVGRNVRVTATYTDDQGTIENLVSADVGPVNGVNDPGSVGITGTPTEDQTLTASVSDIDGITGAISYQWQRFDGATWNDIGGATLSTYTLGDLDVGQNVRVMATYTDDQGTPESLVSLDVGPIANVNDPGNVGVTGAPTEDQTLTASVSDIDGATGPIGYQWQRFDGSTWNDIVGATASAYLLGDADVGVDVRVIAAYTDDRGTPESLTSAPVGPITNINDPGSVSITGAPTEGQTLTASVSDVDGATGPISYQWQRFDGSTWNDIVGEMASTYLLVNADVGQDVRVTANYTDDQGTPENLVSAPVGPVANINDPGSVSITGTPTEDQTLTASVTDADGIGGTVNYQWERFDGSTWNAIGGATLSTYTLGDLDVGQDVRVTATYTDDQGTPENLVSAPAGPIANVNDPGSVGITGTPTEDQTLTANVSDIDGTTGLISYQWQRFDGSTWNDIVGATASTYLLGDADVGQLVRVTASYTDDQGTAENLVSLDVGPIANVNDIPAVVTSGGILAYIENDPATPVDPAVSIADIDNTTLAGATVRITGGYVSGEDVLSFTSAGGISGAWDAPTGTLTLTGPATLLDWQTVLQSVAYLNTSENPTTGARTIELVVNDGSANSVPAMRTVDVTAVNDAPTSTNDTITTAEDTALVLTVNDFGSYADLEGTPLAEARISALASDGALEYDTTGAGSWSPVTANQVVSATDISAGRLRFAPDLNESGSPYATIGFEVGDGTDFSAATYTLTVNVTVANDPPVAGDDGPFVVDEDASLTVSAASGVLGNDADIDSGSITAVLVAGPSDAAAFSLNADGSFTYTPRADFYGTDTFTYQAFDGSASSNTATVTITVNPVADYVLVVDTAADVIDGDVSSIDALLKTKGADGFISLREAIVATNNSPNGVGPDQIRFDITGLQTINVLSALPTISDAVIIDGTTDPDFAGTPVIVLDGSGAGAGVHGLRLDAGDSIIRGLVIDNFRGSGLYVGGSGGNLIQGNYIGVNATGSVAAGNNGYGIWLVSGNNVVGGNTASDRNVIAGSGIDGVYVAGSSGNYIQGNYIGTDAAGTAAIGNAEDGIWLQNASNNTIGGTTAGEGNLISGNDWSGIAFTGGGSDNAIMGNLIGVDAAGSGPLGNSHYGIQLEGPDGTTVGGTTAGAGNVIAYSGWDGVAINTGVGHSVLGNSIFANGELGIDIGNDGLSAQSSDAGDLDTGPNDWMNFPVIYSVLLSGGNVTVNGEARPGALVQIFKADADPSGYGEGQTLLYSGTVSAGAPGAVDPTALQFSFTFAAGAVAAGDQITATATDAAGNTSEFAKNAYVSTALPGITVTPVSGLVTTEDGGTATFSVVLESQPNASVTIAIASDNLSEGTVPIATLAFDSSNWSTAQTVTVTGVGDFVTDGSVAYNIVLSPAASTDVGYNGIDPADVSVTNQDGVNDAPVINVPPAQIIAEDTPLVLSTGTGNAISISDSDAGPNPLRVTLTSAQGTMTLAGVSGLTFTVGTGTAETTMTFTGVLTDINAALDGLRFDPAPGYGGSASITIDIDDQGNSGSGGPQSASGTVDITVNAVNDAPTIDLDVDDSSGALGADYQRNYTEQSGPGLIIDSTDAVLGDVDSPSLASLTVTITNADFDGSAEFLSADTTGTSIVATYSSGTGVLTLNGADTVANYQQVLRTVRYDNTSDAPSANPRLITFVASDGGASSSVATSTVTIVRVNDAPIANIAAASYAAVENAAPLVLHGTGMTVSDVDALSTSIVDVYIDSISGLLSATQGSSGVTITGSGSPTLTLTGTIAQINALLAGSTTGTVTYTVGSDSPAPTDTLSLAINDRGATGSGGALWGWDSVTVNLTAVNDAPLITIPGLASTPEDTTLVFSAGGGNQISITDVDAGGAPVQVSLSATNGLITLAGITGLSFSAGDGTADSSMTFTGTVADINAALDGLSFAPTPDFNGSAFLSVSVNDQGNSGLGGPLADADFATITVTPANDAPDGTDSTVTTPQDTPLVLGVADFGFTDGDTGDTLNAVRIDALPAAGSLTLSGAAVTVGQVVAVADISAGNLVFTPVTGASGTPYATIDFSVQDSAGAFDTNPNTLTVNVATPVNNPPAGTNGTVVTTVSTDYVFTAGDFGFSDPDAGDLMSEVRIDTLPSVLVGTLYNGVLPVLLGQTVTAGDIASGLLVFRPVLLVTGSASFDFSVRDTNGPDFDPTPNTMTVNVIAVSNNPVNTVPGTKTVNEDTALSIGGVSVTDPNGDLATVQLTVGNGAVSVSLAGGATIGAGVNGSATLTLAGTQAQINAALATLSYQGSLDFVGADVLTVLSTDLVGNTDTDTVDITVAPVNDAPTITLPAGYAVTEGSFLTLAGTGISVSDVDAAASIVRVTLAMNTGVLQVSGAPTVTISGSGTPLVTLDGTVGNINTLLASGLVNYLVISDSPPATDTLTLSINDNGASGAGGPRSASATSTIAITAVNDAPVNTLPGGSTTLEDTPFVYSAAGGNQISITDVDASGAPVEVTLNVSNGVVSLSGIGGLAFSSGDGLADSFMRFTGSVADINTALNNLVFAPNLNYNGLAFITMTTNDLGASGSGGAQTDADLATIDVLPVNDAPDGTDTTVTAIEDTPYAFTLPNFGFNDVDSGEGDTMTDVRIDAISLPVGATLQLSGTDVVAGQIITVADINAGNLVFTPVPDANGPNYASFTFSVRDFGVPPGPLFDPVPNTMTIDVAPVNDLPVITSDGGLSTAAFVLAENTTAVTTVTATDVDLQPLNYSISGGADAARFTIDAVTGVLAFAPAPNFEAPTDAGSDNIYNVTVRVSDGFGGSDTQALTITVTDVDDAPFALADAYATNEDTSLTVTAPGALGNDYDEDGSPISATLVSGPSRGTLAFNADGSFVYTPDANFFGTDSFVYRVSDGSLQSGNATVTLTVNGIPDAPTSANGNVNTDEGVSYTFTLADFSYSDADGDPLDHIEITSLPVDGTLMLGGTAVAVNDIVTVADIAAGNLTYTPPASVPGPIADQFGFRVHDGTQYQAGNQLMTVGVAPLPVVAPPPPSGGGGTPPPPSTGGSDDSGSGSGGDSGSGSASAGEAPPAGGGRSGSSSGGESSAPAPEAPAQEAAQVESTDSAATLAAPSVADSSLSVRAGGIAAAPGDGGLGTPAVSEATKHEKEAEEAAVAAISAPEFQEDLDKLRQENEAEATGETRVAGTVFAASTSLSVGYVIWLLRGGVLLSSLLSSLPAWRLVDPLPVLSRLSDGSDDDDDASLEELVTQEGDDEHGDDDADDAIAGEMVDHETARNR